MLDLFILYLHKCYAGRISIILATAVFGGAKMVFCLERSPAFQVSRGFELAIPSVIHVVTEKLPFHNKSASHVSVLSTIPPLYVDVLPSDLPSVAVIHW